ncbi:gametocyte-specific factor 1-like isoform X2 [Corticium candelabrum]|uniref:gametocyte-specific factor 1-like isoform X2 n=1 Tax=Corticium candelabrum TaxID=121492 RepID=UPI002E257E95|nr:gametocyte-specific factor 1-like isoform X2 [Corticium candelabrum]
MRPSRAIAPGSRLLCSTGMIIDPISGRFVDQRMAHLDPEELLECPFDPLHQIRAKRFQYHLVKCSKQHGRPFYQCPNNARHVKTSKEDFDAHKLVCEDRKQVEAEIRHAMGQTTTPFKGNTTLPEYEWRRPDPDEDWETGMWMICTYVLE